MITENNFSQDQCQLYELMSKLSDDLYKAGWLSCLEYSIWDMLEDSDTALTPELVEIKRLSESTGGWIIWQDEEFGAVANEPGPRFVSMAEWLAMVKKA